MRWSGLTLFVVLSVPALVWAAVDPQPQVSATAELRAAIPDVRLYGDAERPTRVFGKPISYGATPEESAHAFVLAHSAVFGVPAADLAPGTLDGRFTQPVMIDPLTGGPKFTLVYYTQMRDGIPVYDGTLRLLVRHLPGNPLALAASNVRDLGDFVVDAAALRNTADSAAYAAAAAEFPGLVNFTPTELMIYAGQEALRSSAPALALVFVADGTSPSGEPLKREFVCDAGDGRVLYSRSLICQVDVLGTVGGMATQGIKSDNCELEIAMPMPYARVSIGATNAFADLNGNFTIPNGGSGAVTVQSYMDGTYFTVDNVAGAEETLSLLVTPPGPAAFMHNAANTNAAIRAQVNGYIQANLVRDWILAQVPGYPTIATQTGFPVKVNRTDGYCPGNAWYDGSSINFCSASGSYPNTAWQSVIFHEYGHHLVATGGSGQGAYGEGMSDCVAMLPVDDPILGYGFFGDCNSGLRTAENTFQYPCSGEIHECGQLLSGCVWDARQALEVTHPGEGLALISELTVASVLLHSGDGIAPDITIDFLTLDDDDADLENGTPHYDGICAGFNAHNMDCPLVLPLGFNFPNGRPNLVSPTGSTRIRVQVTGLSGQPQDNSGMLYYKIGNTSFVSVPMERIGPNLYDAVIPASACGSNIQYYFSAMTATNQVVYNPSGAPAENYGALSGYALIVTTDDTFQVESGWTVGDLGDNATTGIWSRNMPQATAAQPGEDHTPGTGTICWVTDYRAGTSIGTYDVDNGKTTVKSPNYNLAAYPSAKVSYWRWYSNDEGDGPNTDTFRVDISSNGGTSWVNVETVGPAGPETSGGWFYHEFSVGSYIPLTSQVRLRFIAEDLSPGSIVEAAIDDFRIETVDCTPVYPVGDLDCSGAVDFGDINPFVLALSNPDAYASLYPTCDIMLADIDGNSTVNFADINPFVALLTGN